MNIGSHYPLWTTLRWTRAYILYFLCIAAVPTVLYSIIGWNELAIPWLPVSLIGTAVAFLVGFRNNATYDRMWEARKVWGAIVNNSRSWGLLVNDYLSVDHAHTQHSEVALAAIRKHLIYRHLAWLTALRYQLRQPRAWEYQDQKSNRDFRRRYQIAVPEWTVPLETEIAPFLAPDEAAQVLAKPQHTVHLLALQSAALRQAHDAGYMDSFRHMEMEKLIMEFVNSQGQCERTKNTPYPRQFASMNRYIVWLLILLLPFAMLSEFEAMGSAYVWLNIPFCALISWVFFTMERIGEATENPFEGGPNDIPITALCRTIEIDLRQMRNETEIPKPLQPVGSLLY
jgi:ion channel-forming bestrophin family protein